MRLTMKPTTNASTWRLFGWLCIAGVAVLLPAVRLVHAYEEADAGDDDAGSPFLDLASSFLQSQLANQQGGAKSGGGGGGGLNLEALGSIASLVGNLVQPDAGKAAGGRSGGGGGLGAAQILAGLGSLMANANGGGGGGAGGGGGGFDPSIIGNVIEMFTSAQQQGGSADSGHGNGAGKRKKRNQEAQSQEPGIGLDTVMNLVSMFANNLQGAGASAGGKRTGGRSAEPDQGLMGLLPMVMQAVNSFAGADGDRTRAKHQDHAFVLPPFLEKVHVMWDHFTHSELAEALWQKSGVHAIFKGFTGRDGKLDYDRLFESLNNQSFRRRWIKSATLYLSDWANYIAVPEVYQRYFATGQLMFNGFLQSQNVPAKAHFDPARPSETLSQLVDHVARQYLHTKVASITYVKPAVAYVRDLLRLGEARGLLQQFNATELSDRLTDTVNLEILEPVLKVHRVYRFAVQQPHCDRYVLCELNSHDPHEQLGLAGIKPNITRFGSMAAAWFVSSETGTPFWSLFGVIQEPYNCAERFPVDCTDFHEGEARVTTEYAHNEL